MIGFLGLSGGDRRYHIYVIGKTTLLLRHIPNSRAKDVVYFDPADAKNIGLNVLENVEPERSIWLPLFYMMWLHVSKINAIEAMASISMPHAFVILWLR